MAADNLPGCSARNLDHNANLLLEIVLADDGGLLRRSRFVRNPIEFDDRPAMKFNHVQRGEDRRKVDAATTEFHKLERISCLRRIGGNIANVFEVKEEHTVVILF